MTNFNLILKKIGKEDLSDFPDVMSYDRDMEKSLWVLWILQKKYNLDDDYFTSVQISDVLKKRKIPLNSSQVALSLRKASRNNYVDKKTEKKSIFTC
jgi:hypothetical protein